MFSRRPGARFNRGRAGSPQVVASGPSAVIDDNWLTYLDADSGPVGTPSTAVGNDVTDWLTLVGSYDWAQTSSGNRPVISETTMGSVRTVDFNGTTDWLIDDLVGMASDLSGDDTAFTMFVHYQSLSVTGDQALINTCAQTNNNRHQVLSTTDDLRTIRRAGGPTVFQDAVNVLPISTEFTVTMAWGADAVNAWVNGTQVMTGLSLATVATAFTRCMMGAVDVSGAAANFANIGVRRAGIRLGAVGAAGAAAIDALRGT